MDTDGHRFYRRQQSQLRELTKEGDACGNILTAESAKQKVAEGKSQTRTLTTDGH